MERVDLFFYGLFMDEELLRLKGVSPQDVRHAIVDDFALRIGRRAALVPEPGRQVHGILMSLTHAEIERLYSEPSLLEYKPEAVLTRLTSGLRVAALCYNLPVPPAPEERSQEYAEKLHVVADKVGLAAAYVASITKGDTN